MDIFGAVYGAQWWEAMQAFGTLGAVLVALGIPLFDYIANFNARREARAEKHRKTASLVSAWVETTFEATERGKYFSKRAILYIANESDEPVFDVVVDVATGLPRRQVGPLSAPSPIPVLPARRQRSFDISMGLLAQEAPQGAISLWEPAARISFSDRKNDTWIRDYDGSLIEEKKNHSRQGPIDNSIEQIGISSHLNPMAVAFEFYGHLVSENPPDLNDVKSLLDKEATAWDSFTQQDLEALRHDMADLAMPVHVWYRTNRVAYVRLIEDKSITEVRNTKTPTKVDRGAQLITLVFRRTEGWKIFAIGAVGAEWIEFREGELNEDPRSYLNDL